MPAPLHFITEMALDTRTFVSAPEAERDTLPFFGWGWRWRWTCSRAAGKRKSGFMPFLFFNLFFSGHQQSSRQSATSAPRRAQIPRSPRLSAFERDNHVCQHMAPGVTRWITKDSDCCWAGSLTERSGRTATVAGDRWASRRKIEGGRVWNIGPSKEDRAD